MYSTMKIVIFLFLLTISTSVKGEVEQRTKHNVHEVTSTTLLVVVLTYDTYCFEQNKNALAEFRKAAETAKQNGLNEQLDMKFVQIDERDDCGRDCTFRMTCIAPPKLKLFKYGREIEYTDSITIKALFTWLEKNTTPAAAKIENENELKGFTQGNEFSILGYFKNDSKIRLVFWNVASKMKDFRWAEVTENSINPYTVDTIILTQQFGNANLTLGGESNLTESQIMKFVKKHANSSGPIFEMKNDQQLQEVIDQHFFTFIVFYDLTCSPPQEIPEYVEHVVQTAIANGMPMFRNILFVKVDISSLTGVSNQVLEKYPIKRNCFKGKLWENSHIVLVKYGQLLKYPDNGMGMTVRSQKTETFEGLFEWLEKHTKPPVKIILDEVDLKNFVDYTEVTIIGYYKPGSKTQGIFWKVANKLKDYKWGEVVNGFINNYDVDTIIINQEYGVSRLMQNENLTPETIESFVKTNANSTTFPVPTRPIPTVRPDLNASYDMTHYQQEVVFIYTKTQFLGNEYKIEVGSLGCTNLTGDWERVAQSIKTFGRCVVIYESFGCESTSPEDQIRLDNSNVLLQYDLGLAAFHKLIRSIELCSHLESRKPSTSATSSLMNHAYWKNTGLLTFVSSVLGLTYVLRI